MRGMHGHRTGRDGSKPAGGRGLPWLAALAAALMLSLVGASAAGAHQLLEFEREATLAANGAIPAIPANPLEEVKEACGSETAVFGSELFNTPLSQIQVRNEWGDIVPGREMMVSGTVSDVEFSGGDLPIDHPFSTDFTFNVALDEAYWPLARELGIGGSGGSHELHMELEVGSLLHSMPQIEGPAEGEPWDLLPGEQTEPATPTLNGRAHENLVAAYQPHVGERIAVRGRWIIDCGHSDFHAELHPVTFMAFAHRAGSKTVVHVISNPYRVTQLYGAGTGEVNSAAPKGEPFPQALESAVSTVTQEAIAGIPAAITMRVGIERTQPSTAPWIVCPPAGATGKPRLRHHFVTRRGVRVLVRRLDGGRCGEVSVRVGGPSGGFGNYTALQPPSRLCELSWPLISAEVAGGLGISGLRRDEVEQITVDAAGGTFTIGHGGGETEPIPYNATAEQVRSALEALPSIGAGNVVVTGGPGALGGGSYTVTFVGELAQTAITPLTTNNSALTPAGGVHLATVVVLVPGGTLDMHRFILSEIERKEKAALQAAEEQGALVGAISRIEANLAMTPQVDCLSPLSGPLPAGTGAAIRRDQRQPFPYYGEVTVE